MPFPRHAGDRGPASPASSRPGGSKILTARLFTHVQSGSIVSCCSGTCRAHRSLARPSRIIGKGRHSSFSISAKASGDLDGSDGGAGL
jgi:hypothetical protein